MKSKFVVFIILPMHLFFLYSIFDIYFTSPLICQIQTVPVTHKPLANRLVLYVIDGLRANKLFDNDMKPVPFLKNLMMKGNSWGISNTRVPTETRPGHVALIAGFYEDVSSITKGWQENAVEFDSLFNRSSNTWSWGSPDVLPMFQKGAIKDKIHIFCYKAEQEDFAGNRTWELDTWVFNEVKQFFGKVEPNSDLDRDLKREGVVVFLHLLGIDVSGHSQKPHSELYTKNLKIVSEGIEEMTNLFDTFYEDNKTAYIVTSDHGMTDWGSHGAGSVDETMTPVITWGSGFYNAKTSNIKLNKTSNKFPLSNFKMDSGMSDSLQNDIYQADLCVLMASILGIHIPINSVGVVPIDYIDSDDATKAEILRANIRQLFIQYETKYKQKVQRSLVHFQEYDELPMNKAHELLEMGNRMISQREYKSAIALYHKLSQQILNGITYYHKYDRLWLSVLFSSSFVLWILYLATHIVRIRVCEENPCKLIHWIILLASIIFYSIYIFIEQQPYSYFMYQIIPTVILWSTIVFKRPQVKYLFRLAKENYGFLIGVILLTESIVWSFFYRQVLSVGLLVAYLIVFKSTFSVINADLKFKWTIACALLMIYPILPVIAGHNSRGLVLVGGVINCIFTFWTLFSNRTTSAFSEQFVSLKGLLLLISIFTTYHVFDCQAKLESGAGLSFFSQCFSWTLFLSLLPIVCFSHMYSNDRLDLLFVVLGIMYHLTSIYYELLFYVSLLLFATTWKEIEMTYRSENVSRSTIDRRKIIQTIIYVFLLTFSFFATGNIASLNSFDVTSTYCFVTVFKPFIMGFILLVKIMLPMLVISLVYVFIQNEQRENIHFSTHGPPCTVPQINIEEICLVTMISDFAALHFLFLIKDYGSWLEIGTSISHYVITMGISICAFLFTLLSKYLLTIRLIIPDFDELKSK